MSVCLNISTFEIDPPPHSNDHSNKEHRIEPPFDEGSSTDLCHHKEKRHITTHQFCRNSIKAEANKHPTSPTACHRRTSQGIAKRTPGIDIPDHNNNNNNNGPDSILLIIVIAAVVQQQHPYCASTDIPVQSLISDQNATTRTAPASQQEVIYSIPAHPHRFSIPVRLLSPVPSRKPTTKIPKTPPTASPDSDQQDSTIGTTPAFSLPIRNYGRPICGIHNHREGLFRWIRNFARRGGTHQWGTHIPTTA